ncbi:MAG TPA: UDP-2,3-diacylglucosamine diphosphatase LpxI [Beijerinckiaceae bacterium]|jgi:DUF1009 family protein
MTDLSEGPVAILAGSGSLPLRLIGALRANGRACRVLAFRGFAERALRRHADAVVDLLDVRRALECLDGWRPAAVTLAGGVTRPRPALAVNAATNAVALWRNRSEIRHLLSGGDDHVLRAVVTMLEERGFPVIGAHELDPSLLASLGSIGRHPPDETSREAAVHGVALLAALSPFDIGQAAVVAGRRVLAVEGPEGTDRMLRRVARQQGGWFSRPAGEGVLVKVAKRGQDLRVDMPAVGPRTFVEAARAGLKGVAVGAGTTLVLDRAETIATADRLGLFFVGLPVTGAAP